MNPSPLATPYRMEALFFEELEALLLELELAFAEADELAVPLLPAAMPVAALLPLDVLALDFLLDVDADAVPALACVVPDFRIYDGISTVLRDVVLIFCAVSVTSRAYPISRDFLIDRLVIPMSV